jgi:hypothetical protein
MQLLILYRPQSEHARNVEEFTEHLQRVYPEVSGLTPMDVDSIDGSDKAKLYDVMQYPAILVIQQDGTLVNKWTGEPLPLVDEVAGYLRL